MTHDDLLTTCRGLKSAVRVTEERSSFTDRHDHSPASNITMRAIKHAVQEAQVFFQRVGAFRFQDEELVTQEIRSRVVRHRTRSRDPD